MTDTQSAPLRDALLTIVKEYIEAPGEAAPTPTTDLVWKMYVVARDALRTVPVPQAQYTTEYFARTSSEKDKVRRLIKQGKAEIVGREAESHVVRVNGRNRLSSYECWTVRPL